MELPYTASEIKPWLASALAKEDLTDFSINILGNSGKGDGYIGDIIFAKLSATTKNNSSKEYNLVLKCGKRSLVLRDKVPVRESFENEIYLYCEVFVAFKQFQLDKGIKDIFDSVPKCYGTFTSNNVEVIALENLKELGFSLYDRKKPLTADHLNLIVEEYGKWHAISAAMQDQDLERFTQLTSGIKDLWRSFKSSMDSIKFFASPIQEIHDLVKCDVSPNAAEKLENLKSQIEYVMQELIYEKQYFYVITHGDCWNNNFMFKYEDATKRKPVKIAMLDWQLSKFCSPVTDLSYFIYSCISSDDLRRFDDVLERYYKSFSDFVRKLGSNPDEIYPFSQFLSDWKVFARFGVMMALMVMKIAVCDQDEVADLAETVESGLDMSATFLYDVKDKELLKYRVLCVVEHIVERDFI